MTPNLNTILDSMTHASDDGNREHWRTLWGQYERLWVQFGGEGSLRERILEQMKEDGTSDDWQTMKSAGYHWCEEALDLLFRLADAI